MKNKIDSNNNVITYKSKNYSEFDFGKNLNLNNVSTVIYYQNQFLYNLVPTENNVDIVFSGGYLINEMGMGKTITMLCFLLQDENATFNQFVNKDLTNNCNYFFKRGANAGKHCESLINSKKSELYCTLHYKTPFIDKKIITFKNLEFFNLDDYLVNYHIGGIDKLFYNTNASIILCPAHLCDQWAKEFYTNFKTDRRILLVVTYDQFNNLTFGDVLFADIIIVSYNFLLNAKYKVKCQAKPKDLVKLTEKQKILSSKNFHFGMFNFKHKILDEFHEIVKMPSKIEYELSQLKSKYTWNVSGTPFANGIPGFAAGLNYITSEATDISYFVKLTLPNILYNNINKDLVKNTGILFRRNTKESIKNEFSGNIINNTLKLLEFTLPERNIYDSYNKGQSDKNYNFLIQLCCDPEINAETQSLIKNCKSLDEIQKVLLTHNKDKLSKSQSKINNIKNDIYLIEQEILTLPPNSNDAMDCRLELGNYRRSLTAEMKNYDNIKRIHDYLENVAKNITVSETCPICLDDTTEENLAITKCGHKFCWDCINEYIQETKSQKCPKCNIQINLSDIFLLKEKTADIILPETSELNTLIQDMKSTKLGNIIYYIMNEVKNNELQELCFNKSKIIIFSQWDTLLNKINTLLDKYKIKSCIVKGSVYQRKNAIQEFSNLQSTTHVILLSSNNAASGINLTAANKIILVEPVYGSIEYRKDIENQACGRCDRLNQKRPIEVIRYIIKDTIEQEIYNNGYSTDLDTKNLQVLEL